MQPDLIGLEFTKGELKRLTGVNPDNVLRGSIWQNREKRFSFLSNEFVKVFVPTVIIVGLVYILVIRTTIGTSIAGAIALFIITFILITLGRWIWQQKIYPQPLKNLLNNVDRYHRVIYDIATIDEAETSTNQVERNALLQALQQLRANLVQALQIERSLRQSQPIDTPDLLSPPKLTNIQTQEYAPIVNALLQISSSVQAEVRKLQAQIL
ncbi:hypothetical protein Glo7428_4844 [Gloeocapsa sp. PCC 7428]|uniref:hypothetical protein n=1 Tax=Gloeocapsa sp. PCC 7428 TaxID=1173026 RepID=UPI0002A5C8A8|nr:hypothetical protein [Gloeocapsa sp. PCC 7428]AFZ33272.1 hypothetical protein Glo7428_4844 [Gloeocapsa sp. PCC 7428]